MYAIQLINAEIASKRLDLLDYENKLKDINIKLNNILQSKCKLNAEIASLQEAIQKLS